MEGIEMKNLDAVRFFLFVVDDDKRRRVYGYLFSSILFLPVAQPKSLNKYLPM